MAQSKALRINWKFQNEVLMAYANSYSQKEYYLNSVASPIYLNPVGEMDFKGLSAEILFSRIFRKNLV
jgi:protease-4